MKEAKNTSTLLSTGSIFYSICCFHNLFLNYFNTT